MCIRDSLCSGEITYDQLTGDTLHFYAYILNANGQTLKVKLRNSQTSQNGQYLTADGRNYQARLCRGETNYLSLIHIWSPIFSAPEEISRLMMPTSWAYRGMLLLRDSLLSRIALCSIR